MEITPRYRPSWMIRLVQSRPHWDISFRVVNDTFNLKDELYLESLGIWASAPALVLILSLLVLFFYLLAYCCRRRTAKKHKFGFLRWVLVFFAILCCGALACAMYGNESVHASIVDFVRHLDAIDRRASAAKNQTDDVSGKLDKDIEPRLGLLREEFGRQADDAQVRLAVDSMLKNVTEAKANITAINGRIGRVDYSSIAVVITRVESIRWPVTMAVMGVFVLFCLVLLLGLVRHSRRTLMLFSALGLIATVITGLLVCAVFVIAMGLSDICVAPDQFVLDNMDKYHPRPIAEFYIKCNPLADNPFEDFITASLRATNSMQNSLNLVTEIAEQFDEEKSRQHQQLRPNLVKVGQAVNLTSQSIIKLNEALHCRSVHNEYVRALENGCNRLMYSLTWVLLSVTGACLLFYLLVILDSHLWLYMRKRNFLNTEETDPFLPQGQQQGRGSASQGTGSLNHRNNITMTSSLGPNYRTRHYSNTHTPPQTPPYPSTLNGRMSTDNNNPHYIYHQQQQQQQHQQQQYRDHYATHGHGHGHHMGTLPLNFQEEEEDPGESASVSTLPMRFQH